MHYSISEEGRSQALSLLERLTGSQESQEKKA